MSDEHSVAIPEEVDGRLRAHLLRSDGQEDLTFALWNPSQGERRLTAMVQELLLPEEADRTVHGNVSFHPSYLQRVLQKAARKQYGGVALLHSHLGPGWQAMSPDDVAAEQSIAAAVLTVTDLPLFGLTLGTDGTWSARMWPRVAPRRYEPSWCHSVRVVGEQLRSSFADMLLGPPQFRPLFRRTATVWGPHNHAQMARLRVGIVGLGSVGSIVAETLARMGMTRLVLIDFDEVQEHNLDRLLGATSNDIGALKVNVTGRQVERSATAAQVEVCRVPYSVAEEAGYRAALDCDVLFSCVDRPRARSILNHLAYGHLIPVIDGGIGVRFKQDRFAGVDWQLQTVAPGRPCLQCLGVFEPSDVSTEAEGLLDDPSYLAGLPKDHRFKYNENVFPFSANLASLEVLQFVALATGIANQPDFGVQRYRYVPGVLDSRTQERCRADCDAVRLLGQGDRYFQLFNRDQAAEAARRRQTG